MTNNEMLLAISDMMDKKLQTELRPIKEDIRGMKADIRNVKADTYNRYSNDADRMERAFDDIELLKKVVTEHSEKLQKIS